MKVTLKAVECNELMLMFVMFSVVPQTPTLSRSPTDATIQTGTAVTFTCTTASSGSTTYTFLRDSTQVQSGASATLDLTSAAPSNTGSYTCTATISGVDSVASNADSLTVVGEYRVQLHGRGSRCVDNGPCVHWTRARCCAVLWRIRDL